MHIAYADAIRRNMYRRFQGGKVWNLTVKHWIPYNESIFMFKCEYKSFCWAAIHHECTVFPFGIIHREDCHCWNTSCNHNCVKIWPMTRGPTPQQSCLYIPVYTIIYLFSYTLFKCVLLLLMCGLCNDYPRIFKLLKLLSLWFVWYAGMRTCYHPSPISTCILFVDEPLLLRALFIFFRKWTQELINHPLFLAPLPYIYIYIYIYYIYIYT